ncbi:unannotated protein [freshwater metagenome]|uniref:Unannotated protein n=1 Tax=freshwater metagenome TaxID=449393 RepID=A0A6J6YEZ5_9ZZZZ
MLVPTFPDVLGNKIIDAHNENIFVMTAIKDDHAAIARGVFVHSPQVIVGKFNIVGTFEIFYLHADRIDGAEHVLDGSVFAGGVHSLQDDEHLVFGFRVQHSLQFGEPFVERWEQCCALFFVTIKPIGGTC